MQISELYDIAAAREIKIIKHNFSKKRKAAALKIQSIKAIVLDVVSVENDFELKEILAEEIGHFETCSLYFLHGDLNSRTSQMNRHKAEAQAQRWAYDKLVPFLELETLLKKSYLSIYEIAEEFGVEVEYLARTIEVYKSRNML